MIPEAGDQGFAALGLRAEVLRAITDAGYTQPTPIQAEAIPEILARHDLVGIAQTGTGKTASFVLPMLDILASGRARARMPRSLILSPTRELAAQTSRNFDIYGRYLSLSMVLIIGGVGMGDQEKALEKGVDVLIATPGRLLDWHERGKVMLNGVEILVIDEADRMFDMGFMPDVERIITLLLGRRQTLLFSATMPPEVRRLAERFLAKPKEIKVSPAASTSANIEDVIVEVPEHEGKKRTLVDLIRGSAVPKAIVFCNRKRDISGVMRHLQRAGLRARDLHGDLDQSHRIATLDQFTKGDVDFLVATDVAARGLDISDMPVVVNYDVPINAEDYVHRIGRTGRAGRKGRAFTFATPDDRKGVANIERLTKRVIPRVRSDLRPAPAIADGHEAMPVSEPSRPASGSRGPARGRPPRERGYPVDRPDSFVRSMVEPPAARDTRAVPAVLDEVAVPPPVAAPPPESSTRDRRRQPSRPAQAAPAANGADDRSGTPARGAGGKATPAVLAEPAPSVGFGDHVPRFLIEPIPARLLKSKTEPDLQAAD